MHQHWLTEEVAYIIESDERKVFLSLTSDDARDAFIKSFWESRNPTPGAESNSYKDEHYRRLAYANEHFGNLPRHDGWASDQGQVYITLGEPKQKITYPNSQNVRPIEIWFYQAPSPALPAFFSVLFYKRGPGDPFTLYSPYQDGPARLATGLEAENDQVRSLQQIRRSLGNEVARTALTLLPTEPVDFQSFQPGMASDTMLATIRGLADSPLEIEHVKQNKQREKVTASIFLGGRNPQVSYTVTRDEAGQSRVDYFLRMPEPDRDIVGSQPDGTVGYAMTLQEHIVTETGRPVYDTVSTLTGALQPAQLEAARSRVFAAEDQFPLAPGRYIVQSTLTNRRNSSAYRLNTAIEVPGTRTGLSLSVPVGYAGNPVHMDGQRLPFTYANVRFPPIGVGAFYLHAGDPLRCVLQVGLPRDSAGKWQIKPVALRFYYGALTNGATVQDEADETLDVSNADADGNLVTGHEFHTDGLAPGTYRVIIRAKQEGSAYVYSTATLRIVPRETVTALWSAYAPPEPQQDQQKRELSAKAMQTK